MIKISSLGGGQSWVAFANFFGVSAPTMADFKLPIWSLSKGGVGKRHAQSDQGPAQCTTAAHTPELPPSASLFRGKAHWGHPSTCPSAGETHARCLQMTTYSFILLRDKKRRLAKWRKKSNNLKEEPLDECTRPWMGAGMIQRQEGIWFWNFNMYPQGDSRRYSTFKCNKKSS